MINIENHIILDKVETWPDKVLNLIENSKKELNNFLQEERRIDKLGEKDILIRLQCNRPQNIYSEEWNRTIKNINKILKGYNIIGIHCTKLMDYEILDILENGLQPLNKIFANQRVERLYKKGLISQATKNELENKDELCCEHRNGYIFVFHCLSTLKDESGLNRLFGYWGGESLYAYLKNPRELKQIGTSCIVFTSIKIKELAIDPELSKRMIASYFDDNYYPHDTDSIIQSKLNVIKVITRKEKLFEDLTNIQNWKDEI
ncbi:MAG: hypothetical protein AB7O47_02735 [Flavobacteriales bacterium]